jgi:hypothetical protein
LGFAKQPASKFQRRVSAPHPFHAHSAWQGRPLRGLSRGGCAVDDPSSATASRWRDSSLNSATHRWPFSRCQFAAPFRLGWLLIEVGSCFFRSFFPAFVSGVVPVRRLASWLR